MKREGAWVGGCKTHVGHLSTDHHLVLWAGVSMVKTSGLRGFPAHGHIRDDHIELVCNKRRLCCKRASFTITHKSLLC